MLRLGTNLQDIFARRELRVLYGQTQSTPYAAQLDAGFNRALGALSGGNAITGAKGAIFPGLVAQKTTGENVTLATTADTTGTAYRQFGLFADYVGGELGGNFPSTWTQIGVWRGAGSVYELLAPAFDTTSLSSQAALDVGGVATEVYMNSNANGQLKSVVGVNVINNAARLISYLSANAIIVELLL